VLRWLQSHLPLTSGHHGEALWIGTGRARRYTPLFLVLVMIGIIDVVFAVLGLRALFFLLAGMAARFHLLSYGLAAVLVFIGAKMLLADWVQLPGLVSLSVGVLLIAGSIAASLWLPPKAQRESA